MCFVLLPFINIDIARIELKICHIGFNAIWIFLHFCALVCLSKMALEIWAKISKMALEICVTYFESCFCEVNIRNDKSQKSIFFSLATNASYLFRKQNKVTERYL